LALDMNGLTRAEQAFQSYFGGSPVVWHLILTIFVLAGYGLLQRIARRIIVRAVDDTKSRYQIARGTTYTLGVLALVLLLNIWVQGITGLATYFGLLSAGMAIALQDPLTNFAGWLFILARRPFKVGDRIQLGDNRGDVVDIRMFRFIIMEVGNWVHADQSTGRILHIPNGLVFKNPVANYDEAFGYIWNELDVTVTFDSNWRRAKDVLTRTVTSHAERLSEDAKARIDEAADTFQIQSAQLTPVVFTSVVEQGVRLSMRYLCRARERRASSSEMWESILSELAKLSDVHLAFPTQRVLHSADVTKAAGVTRNDVARDARAEQIKDAEVDAAPRAAP
jgi:small-conductance mechanosensitive channel